MLLKDFFEKDLVRYSTRNLLRIGVSLATSRGKANRTQLYLRGILTKLLLTLRRTGDHIVIVPGVAMPHAMAESENRFGDGDRVCKIP